jgi:cation diffusion facilitator CzcD-associated flavoprotein CzcO
MTTTHTLIIGASASGLASAVCLQKKGMEFVIVEKSSVVASSWRNHYDRLHLHTSKKFSALPYKRFDDRLPAYPSRMDVVEYLESYASEMKIAPVFNTEVFSLKKQDNHWIAETNNGSYSAKAVIIATGLNRKPRMVDFGGLRTFKGQILHSSKYKNGVAFKNKNILVVGFGNSACEIAICLYEHGASPSLSVRSPVNVLPREIAGLPVLEMGKLTSMLPPAIADKLTAPLIRMLVGDITKLGLKKSKYGPREQIEKQKRIPLLDIGTIKLIRQGAITVYGNIDRIMDNTVFFEDQKQHDFDAIILATGYEHDLANLLGAENEKINKLNTPVGKRTSFGNDGLYFCGFYVSPMGMLREIGIEARKIAEDISAKTPV